MTIVQDQPERVTVRHGRFRVERGYDPSVRVEDFMLKCVGFVGEVTHRDSSGRPQGDLHATGFFVAVDTNDPESLAPAIYFVTAKHVVDDLAGRKVYFLVNKQSGGTITVENALADRWWFHPNDTTADVAITQVWPHPTADIVSVSTLQLATEHLIEKMDIGIGDEVYSTGLFTPAPGTARNVPIVRVGNIAMMSGEQIQTELGFADVYLVEARSLGGVSGAPVFVRPTVQFKITDSRSKARTAYAAGLGFMLIGLMHGHWDIRESEMNKAFFDHDRKRGVNMGIAIVVPAIKILEAIYQPELVTMRKEAEKKDMRRMVPGMDSAKPDKQQPQTLTKDDFESALKKASRKIEPTKP
jgi:hypothetical protein